VTDRERIDALLDEILRLKGAVLTADVEDVAGHESGCIWEKHRLCICELIYKVRSESYNEGWTDGYDEGYEAVILNGG
jgi:hypothetical protein